MYGKSGLELSTENSDADVALARLSKTINKNYHLDQQTREDPLEHLLEAIDKLEFCLGFDHPETGEAYSKMGLACQEIGNYNGASQWLRRAFCVFFKSLGPQDEVTLSVYQQMRHIDTNLDTHELDHVPYEELPSAILEIDKQNQSI